MPRCVLDASAILAFLNGERGSERIEEILGDETEEPLAHAINVVEVYYQAARKLSKSDAERMLRELDDVGISIRRDLDENICCVAGDMRVVVLNSGTAGRGSLADCFCAALAEREQCRVVTSDAKDFEPLELAGRCKLEVFR